MELDENRKVVCLRAGSVLSDLKPSVTRAKLAALYGVMKWRQRV